MAFSLLHRLSVCARGSVSPHGCVFNTRFGSWTRPPRKDWCVQEDRDPKDQDVDERLQALADEEKRKRNKVKFHILRRKMNPPGAPQRKLTWEAMEQIRFLKKEQPQEWSVHRLAEGFSVDPDVIHRVLSSKFVPPPERRMMQNDKVMASLRQQELPAGAAAQQRREALPGKRAAAVLQSGSTEGALVPVAARQSHVTQEEGSRLVAKPERKRKQNAKEVMASLRQQELPAGAAAQQHREALPGKRAAAVLQSGSTDDMSVPVAARQSHVTQEERSGLAVKHVVPVTAVSASALSTPAHGKGLPRKHLAEELYSSDDDDDDEEDDFDDDDEDEDEDLDEDEVWDEEVFEEQELEALKAFENFTPPVQVGNEFFDSDGNFLYSV